MDEPRRTFRLLRQPVDAVKGATDRVAGIAADPTGSGPREAVVTRRFPAGSIAHAQPIAIGTVSVPILLCLLPSGRR